MKLKKLDPNDPYEKMMIDNMKKMKENSRAYQKELQRIFKEIKTKALARVGIHEDIKMDCNLYLGTDEDGGGHFFRGDFLPFSKVGNEYLDDI